MCFVLYLADSLLFPIAPFFSFESQKPLFIAGTFVLSAIGVISLILVFRYDLKHLEKVKSGVSENIGFTYIKMPLKRVMLLSDTAREKWRFEENVCYYFFSKTGSDIFSAKLDPEPIEPPDVIYSLGSDSAIENKYTIGEVASCDEFSYDSEAQSITLPTGIYGKDILVMYRYSPKKSVISTIDWERNGNACKCYILFGLFDYYRYRHWYKSERREEAHDIKEEAKVRQIKENLKVVAALKEDVDAFSRSNPFTKNK